MSKRVNPYKEASVNKFLGCSTAFMFILSIFLPYIKNSFSGVSVSLFNVLNLYIRAYQKYGISDRKDQILMSSILLLFALLFIIPVIYFILQISGHPRISFIFALGMCAITGLLIYGVYNSENMEDSYYVHMGAGMIMQIISSLLAIIFSFIHPIIPKPQSTQINYYVQQPVNNGYQNPANNGYNQNYQYQNPANSGYNQNYQYQNPTNNGYNQNYQYQNPVNNGYDSNYQNATHNSYNGYNNQ